MTETGTHLSPEPLFDPTRFKPPRADKQTFRRVLHFWGFSWVWGVFLVFWGGVSEVLWVFFSAFLVFIQIFLGAITFARICVSKTPSPPPPHWSSILTPRLFRPENNYGLNRPVWARWKEETSWCSPRPKSAGSTAPRWRRRLHEPLTLEVGDLNHGVAVGADEAMALDRLSRGGRMQCYSEWNIKLNSFVYKFTTTWSREHRWGMPFSLAIGCQVGKKSRIFRMKHTGKIGPPPW